ncbi:MAG: permease-like cell division protein FtsX [Clostridia bacterium]|nr:permease-like cell division protein FtsX [Clostridia bacterium]
MLNRISYFLEEGFRNIFRSKVEALSSITTIFMCILVIGLMYITFTNVSYTISSIQDDLSIIAYLDSSTATVNADALMKHIESSDQVEEIEFFSKEEALVEFAGKIENGENLLEQYKDDNPLRDSLRIKLKNQQSQDEVLKMLEESSFVKRIVKPNDAVKFLTKLSNVVNGIGIIFIIILVFMSIILIMNTIKLTVTLRKNDIEIMKYIGATDSFVRIPFVVEGILLGFIGTIVPLLIVYLIYQGIYNTVTSNTADALYSLVSLLSPGDIFAVLIPLSIIIGVGIGTVGSMISVKKFMEV